MGVKSWTDAQSSVIGALALWPEDWAGEVFQKTRPAMFGNASLRHIFEAARDLWTSGKPLDAVTICARAGDEYKELIAQCMTNTPTGMNTPAYIDIMRSEARLDALKREAMAIEEAATEEAAVAAFERMSGILQDTGTVKIVSLADLVSGYIDRMNDPNPPQYMSLGLEKLDKTLCISPGTFVVIGAESSTGKTALALQFAVHLAKSGKRVGFFSLETPEEPLQDRVMSQYQMAGIPMPVSKRKKLSDENLQKAMLAGIASSEMKGDFILTASTLEDIRAITMQNRYEAIFVDYVQLVDTDGKDRTESVCNTSIGLHRMAQQLGVTVFGLSQVTKPEKGRKVVSKDDLRESKQLTNDGEVILLLTMPTEKDAPPNQRLLIVDKNKDGPKIKTRLSFDPEHMTFDQSLTMDDIRTDGRIARQRQEMDRKAKAKAEQIPEEAKNGKMVELDEELEDVPF